LSSAARHPEAGDSVPRGPPAGKRASMRSVSAPADRPVPACLGPWNLDPAGMAVADTSGCRGWDGARGYPPDPRHSPRHAGPRAHQTPSRAAASDEHRQRRLRGRCARCVASPSSRPHHPRRPLYTAVDHDLLQVATDSGCDHSCTRHDCSDSPSAFTGGARVDLPGARRGRTPSIPPVPSGASAYPPT
jgi:hypothetical protein